jgi:hypothetical protein
MRAIVWMMAALILVTLTFDITLVWSARSQLNQAAELALDGAFVEGLSPEDLFRGKSYLDESAGREAAARLVAENLRPELQKTLELQVDFEQDGNRPRAIAILQTYVEVVSTKMLGLRGIPIRIHKTRYHVSRYK